MRQSQKHDQSYAENLKSAERFFLKTSGSAFLFAVTDDEVIQREFSSSLQFLLRGKHRALALYAWSQERHAPNPVEQLRIVLKNQPEIQGLVCTGLDAALENNPELLLQLNFGRESLSGFGMPLLFWLSSKTLPLVSQQAIDLYNQRAGSNLYFEQGLALSDTDYSASRFIVHESVRANHDLRQVDTRLALLEQQFDEAKEKGESVEKLANGIVLELLELYVKIPGATRLVHSLIDEYGMQVDPDEPGHCVTLARGYHYLGSNRLAEELLCKALNAYRELAASNPQTYLPDVAMTLNNLANLQSDRNDYESAEKGYREALQIRRELASSNPQTYLPYVAGTLNNLAVLQSDRNDYESAEKGYREALQIRRELASSNPQTYLPYVAGTLNNLAVLQSDRNDYESAEKGYREALQIRRELASSNPQTYLPYVAGTLINIGLLYQNGLPDREKSLACIKEALSVLLPLTERIPQTRSYFQTAKKVLKDWGIDPDEFIAKLNISHPKTSTGAPFS
jgi:tetratricopeptide (TPR) repeat protein